MTASGAGGPERPRRFGLDELEHPIVQAPLGGGPSTPALAAAVCEAGGLGFLSAGYKTVDAARAEIEALRGRTARPFGVGLFVPGAPAADPDAVERYAGSLRSEAERYSTTLGEPRHDDDGWREKLDLVTDQRVPVVSFTFGRPPAEAVDELHGHGVAAWVTVTTVAEAAAAQEAGADALIVQGVEAGGHRGSYDAGAPGELGLLALLQQLLRREVRTPLVAAGGLATGEGVAAVLVAGATAAALGTAFMLAPEAGTSEAHRLALADEGDTALTRAFTGRPARGLVNRFMREHSAEAPVAYPAVHHVTAPLRAAARERGDAQGLHLGAGQAHALAEELPAGQLVEKLAADARRALEVTAGRFPPN